MPYPTSAVLPGLLKMNMLLLSQDVESGEWSVVLKSDWQTSACLPVVAAQGALSAVCTKMVHGKTLPPSLSLRGR